MTSSEITDMFLYSRWVFSGGQPRSSARQAAGLRGRAGEPAERRARRLKGSSEARTGAFQAMSSGSTSILTLVWAAKCAQTCDPSLPLAPLGPGWSDWTPVRRGADWHRQFGPQACPGYAMPKTTISTVGGFLGNNKPKLGGYYCIRLLTAGVLVNNGPQNDRICDLFHLQRTRESVPGRVLWHLFFSESARRRP